MEFVNFEPLVRESKFLSTATIFTSVGFIAFVFFLMYVI
jgi:hypothetical protein